MTPTRCARWLCPRGLLLATLWALATGCDAGEGAPSGAPTPGEDAGDSSDPGDDASDAALDAEAPGPARPTAVVGCQPLAAEVSCLLPYPSDFFRVAHPADPSASRLHYGPKAARIGEVDADVTALHPAEGFSTAGPILALLPGPFDEASLTPPSGDVARTESPTSPTLLLDTVTGAFVPHFSERDPAPLPGLDRLVILRPLMPLAHNRRYVVALRDFAGPDGVALGRPALLEATLEGAATPPADLPDVDAEEAARALGHLRAEVLPALEAAGVELAAVQLAWDFTTRSREDATRDLIDVRAQALERLAASPPAARVLEVLEGDEVDPVWRRIELELDVPLWVTSAEPGAYLQRDEAGRPNGGDTLAAVPFTIWLPRGAGSRSEPLRAVQFGHGFLGDRGEADQPWHREFAEQAGLMTVAADWWGMSGADIQDLVTPLTAGDVGTALLFVERVHQAMVNFIAVTTALKTTLTEEPALRDADGALLYDPEEIYFYGISQGHILGGVYAALTPHVDRVALSVGGASFGFMMSRATPFQPFLSILELTGVDRMGQHLFMALSATALDRVDPIHYAGWVRRDTLPGSPATRAVLMHLGLGDTQVPSLAGHLHARALGLPLLQPAPRPVPYLEHTETGAESAVVEFDLGVPAPLPGEFIGYVPNNGVHEGVRRLGAAQAQLDAFFRPTGRVEHTCEGPCDPE